SRVAGSRRRGCPVRRNAVRFCVMRLTCPLGTELPMPSTEEFGRWLDLTMENRNISGNKLAEMMNVNISQVSRWRNAKGRPSLKTMYRLGRILEVDPIRL